MAVNKKMIFDETDNFIAEVAKALISSCQGKNIEEFCTSAIHVSADKSWTRFPFHRQLSLNTLKN